MSDAIETIEQSISQTKECQEMVRTLLRYCNELIDEVKRLQVENERLKQEASNGK